MALTASQFNTLKQNIHDEMQRRCGQGSLAEYAGSDYNFTTVPVTGGVIKAEQADGDATLLKTKDGHTISITNMCNAIYRNDSSARDFIDQIDHAIDNISLRCTKIGAYMNRLQSAIDSTDVQKENLTEANSTIKDADVAVSSSNYIKFQILQQSTATLLSTANQMPSIALNLI